VKPISLSVVIESRSYQDMQQSLSNKTGDIKPIKLKKYKSPGGIVRIASVDLPMSE
jgi:hypothetical protein